MTETSFSIEGMTCGHCVGVVTRALLEVPGVTSAAVDLEQEKARVAYDHGQASEEHLIEAVRSAGFEALPAEVTGQSDLPVRGDVQESVETAESKEVDRPRSGWQRVVLDVTGMHCASCTSRVEQALERISGTTQAHANLITEQVTVDYDPRECSTKELEAGLNGAGYPATIVLEQQTAADLANRPGLAAAAWGRRLLWGGCLAVPLLVTHIALSFQSLVFLGWIQLLLASCLQWGLGSSFYVGAWRRARQGSTNMDTLIALGCTAAFGRGLFHFAWHDDATMFLEAGMILTIVTLGKFLEFLKNPQLKKPSLKKPSFRERSVQ
ncbi:MAG: copper ion binding protein [Pirellulaceae bacterium]|nr:copper ion binding protein [Pirellulaceae bacterium]